MSEEKIFKPREGEIPKIRFVNVSKMTKENPDFKNEVILEGYFKGTVPNQYNDDKPHFKFEDFKTGETVIVNNIGNLQHRMTDKNVQEGDLIQITYLGTSPIEKGKFKGKESHQFRVILGD